MEAATRTSRIRLWLRSEKAFGMNAVPRGKSPSIQSEKEEEHIVDRSADASAPQGAAQETRETFIKVSKKPSEMAPRGGLIPPPSVEPFDAEILSPVEKKRRLL